jgi:hypothetical protein
MSMLVRLIISQYPAQGSASAAEKHLTPVSRTAEFLLLAAIDSLLGVTSCMNCKSG